MVQIALSTCMVASGSLVFVCSSDEAVDGLEGSVLVESLHHPK